MFGEMTPPKPTSAAKSRLAEALKRNIARRKQAADKDAPSAPKTSSKRS